MAIGSELLAGFAGPGDRGGRWWDGRSAGGGDFGVSIAYIYKALIRRRLTGDSSPNPNRGHPARKLSPDQEMALAAHIRSRSGITLAQAQAWLLAEHGVSLSMGATWNAARRLGLSFKKSPARGRAGEARRGGPPQAVEGGPAVYRSP